MNMAISYLVLNAETESWAGRVRWIIDMLLDGADPNARGKRRDGARERRCTSTGRPRGGRQGRGRDRGHDYGEGGDGHISGCRARHQGVGHGADHEGHRGARRVGTGALARALITPDAAQRLGIVASLLNKEVYNEPDAKVPAVRSHTQGGHGLPEDDTQKLPTTERVGVQVLTTGDIMRRRRGRYSPCLRGTPLWHSVLEGDMEAFEVLAQARDAPFDVSSVDENGCQLATPLMLAAVKGNFRMFRELMVRTRRRNHMTGGGAALLWAVRMFGARKRARRCSGGRSCWAWTLHSQRASLSQTTRRRGRQRWRQRWARGGRVALARQAGKTVMRVYGTETGVRSASPLSLAAMLRHGGGRQGHGVGERLLEPEETQPCGGKLRKAVKACMRSDKRMGHLLPREMWYIVFGFMKELDFSDGR